MRPLLILGLLLVTIPRMVAGNVISTGQPPQFTEKYALWFNAGITHKSQFTAGFHFVFEHIDVGFDLTFPPQQTQGDDYTTVISSTEYLDQQVGILPSQYSGTSNLHLGYMFNTPKVVPHWGKCASTFGIVLGEAAFRDILQYYGPMMGTVSDYYYIELQAHTRMNYGLYYTYSIFPGRIPLIINLSGQWTRYDGWGFTGGLGIAIRKSEH